MAGYKRKASPYNTVSNYMAFKRARQSTARATLKPSRYAKPTRYIELKYDDGTASGTIPATGSLALISTIANGTGSSNRIGSHVTYNDIEFNWIVNQQVTNILPQYARLYLIYDKQVNGLGTTGAVILNTTTPESLAAPAQRDRFKFLWDSGIMETFYCTSTPDAAYSSANCRGTKRISLKGLKAEYNGTGSAQADIVSGSLYFLLVSSQNNIHGFIETNRIQFYD